MNFDNWYSRPERERPNKPSFEEYNPQAAQKFRRQFRKVSYLRRMNYADIEPYTKYMDEVFWEQGDRGQTETIESLMSDMAEQASKGYIGEEGVASTHEAVACYMILRNMINFENNDRVSVHVHQALAGLLRMIKNDASEILRRL